MGDKIRIRRATRGDLSGIAELVDACRQDTTTGEAQVMEWLFSKGLMVALEEDLLTGVIAWQVENLVAVTDLFCLRAGGSLSEAGCGLLEALEEETTTLMCEANIVLMPEWMSPAVRSVLQEEGYGAEDYSNLHRIWREVLDDLVETMPELWIKRLRDRMVMVPI
ncbi:MAG: hypothetical protein PVJ26_10130 [Anaerolineae bacterium]|jgi:hypothetical protein